MFEIKSQKVNKQHLKNLSSDETIMIKEADKRGAKVIMEGDHYKAMVQ